MPTAVPRRKVTTDEGLYAAFRDRADERALEALVERHWEGSFHLALAVVRDPGAAEDAAQRAFLRVVEAARAARTLDPFRGWLRTVVVNEARMILRSEKNRARIEESSAKPDSGRAPADPAAAVREYAEALPDSLREPLVLHFGLGFTHAEVAEALGAPRTTITSRIQEGTERLRRSLEVASAGAGAVALDGLLAPALDPRHVKAPPRPPVRTLLAKGSTIAVIAGALGGVKAALAVAVATLAIGGLALTGRTDPVAPGGHPSLSSLSSATRSESISVELPPPPSPDSRVVERAQRVETPAPRVVERAPRVETPRIEPLHIEGTALRPDNKPFGGALIRIYLEVAPKTKTGDTHLAAGSRDRETRTGYVKRILERIANGEVVEVAAGQARTDGVFDVAVARDKIASAERVFVAASDATESFAGIAKLQLLLGGEQAPLHLVLSPVGCFTLKVRSAGKPEPDAEVEVNDVAGGGLNTGGALELPVFGVTVEKATDAEGLVVYATSAPAVNVQIRKDGFATEIVEITVNGADVTTDVDLGLAARVTGLVRDSKGVPVAGARVSLFELDSEEGKPLHYRVMGRGVLTDRDGRFAAGEVRPGSRCRLVVFPPEERHDLPFAIIIPVLRVPASELHLVFEPAARVTIVPGFEQGVVPERRWGFRADKKKPDGSWGERAYSRQPREGGVEQKEIFEGLTPGTYRFYVEADEFAPVVSAEVTLRDGDDVKVNLPMIRGRKLAGRVLSASGAAVNGEVTLPWGASADLEDGKFVFAHFPPGDQTLTVVAGDCEPVQVLVRDGQTEVPDTVVSARRR